MGYDTSYDITLMESNASRRLVYFSIMSRLQMGTPVTTMAGSVVSIFVGHSAARASSATLLAENSTLGLYSLQLTQSECSCMGAAGQMCLLASSNSAIPTTGYITIKAMDSGDSMRAGLTALPNAAAAAANGLPTFGTGTGQINLSGGSTGLVPAVFSGVSVEVKTSGIVVASIAKGNYSGVSQEILTGGIQPTSIGAGNYSGMSVEVKTSGIVVASIAKGNYSGVSQEILTGGIQVSSIGKGAYSGVSVEVTTGGIQTSSIGAGSYSGVTMQGLSNYANISNVTLAAGTHSNVTIQGVTLLNSSVSLRSADYTSLVTVGAGNFTPGNYSGVSFEMANSGITAGQAIADRLLLRSPSGGTDSGRSVGDALRMLRNRVEITSSVGTVYQEDDSTSAWTFSIVTTATAVNIIGVNPFGGSA